MADLNQQEHQHHHHLLRPHRLSLPPRNPTPMSSTTSRPYPLYPSYPASTPTPTPSKNRLSSFPSSNNRLNNNPLSFSSLFLLLFSLRSLYSLLPFLRSSPSFSLFPLTFLVSLLSFLLTFAFSLFFSSSKDPSRRRLEQRFFFSLTSIPQSQLRVLLAKSILLAVVFLLRFQALLYCGTAATILAEFSGNIAARFVAEDRDPHTGDRNRGSKVRGFSALVVGLLLLSISWDRIECFPLSSMNVSNGGLSLLPGGNCVRIWPMLLPCLSGFLGSYERVSMNWVSIRQLGRKQVRLISLFFTTIILFFPAVISFLMLEDQGNDVSIGNYGWPLANTVVFGVLLSDNYAEDKYANSINFRKEFLVTFFCTIVLELFYFPELSLWGLVFCGFLLWISVRELDPASLNYPELGSDSSESFSSMIMKPIRHILTERKSRKIALFLLINTAYMVVEFVAGFMSNSLGLISDACHMFFDCAALAIGLYASYISRLPANNQFNYGRGRFEVLSGYVNAVFLVLVGALIVLESLERILDPQEISTNSLLTVSIGGLLVNVVGLIFFHEEHHHAHGGGGSCSHSHSHSHSHHHHHHHSHDHAEHDLKLHGEHHNCLSVSHESHGKSSALDDLHGRYGHIESSTDHSGSSHTHAHNSDFHSHSLCSHSHSHNHQQHDHAEHDLNLRGEHHKCSVSRESHEKSCALDDLHEHHDHIGSSKGGDNICREGGHDQQHQSHQHNCHDHAYKHDFHDHRHVDHLAGATTPITSRSLENQLREDQLNAVPLLHTDSFSLTDHSRSSHTHAHKSDFHSHSASGNTGPLSKESSSETKLPQEPHMHHHHIDHNMEGIFLHVLADTMGSVGVVISTLLIKYKGWLIADPACSIFISVLIIASVIPLLRNSAEILLQRVPRAHEQDLKVALDDVMKIKGVYGIQNLRVWSFTNTDVVGTLHLHVTTETDKASTKAQVAHIFNDAGVKDLTIQVECVKGN
ncbi:probable zinc transporter protein DDB_G0291141 [Macadamia integrifolia]|uniref:probable zinc transporter protein DDB_G0291141 n=1 Tax=Macadamia integrifolia TaxID=60698 RepID=UPI001C501049|nr:probable zinc transporter protein DDB_G0291141 [Macadamia integrifolia]